MPVQVFAMLAALSLGGALVLFGQLTPSEESDWPWRIVTEADVSLNGAPAGSLSDPAPLEEKLSALIKQGRRSGKIEEYDTPKVLIVAEPNVSIAGILSIVNSVRKVDGEPIFVGKSSLEKLSKSAKRNPSAIVVATENADPGMVERSAFLSESEINSYGHRAAFLVGAFADEMQFARTYESSIEIGSDGSYYVNERTAGLELRDSSNVETRLSMTDSNRLPPVAPLKQRRVPSGELSSAVSGLVKKAEEESQKIFIIASEKARYESLLKVLEEISPEADVIVMLRMLW